MREDVINTLEVFRYACIHQSQNVIWDQPTVKRIEKQLLIDPKLERLHALIYQNAIERQQLNWFSSACQTKLKLSTYGLIADIGAKKNQIILLAQILEGQALNVILLKGLAFNSYIYSDNSPRGSSDIDILIKPQDRARFCEVFQQIATVIKRKTDDAFGGLFEETWRANQTSSVYFDLHWYLSYPSLFSFDSKTIEKRSIQHPNYQCENIKLLSNEDHIVYLAAHLVKDCDFFHYGLIDCHELICQQKPDLEKCFLIAQEWGVKTGLYYLLLQCKDMLSTPISEKLLLANKPHFIRNKLCNFVISTLFSQQTKLKTAMHRIKQLCSVFLFCDSFSRALWHNLIYLKRTVVR